ncbi:MAG: DciA family protein [Acidimicrobiia bacterium]
MKERPGSLQPVGELLDGVLSTVGGGNVPPLLTLREQWHEIAGTRWAEVSRPVEIVGDTVIVEVGDGATASLMRYDTGAVEQRLEGVSAAPDLRRIRIKVAARSRHHESGKSS